MFAGPEIQKFVEASTYENTKHRLTFCRIWNTISPLNVVFIDLTKTFDTVSHSGLYNILELLGCPETLLFVLTVFHNNIKAIVQFDSSLSEAYWFAEESNRAASWHQHCSPSFSQIFSPVLIKRRTESCSTLAAASLTSCMLKARPGAYWFMNHCMLMTLFL